MLTDAGISLPEKEEVKKLPTTDARARLQERIDALNNRLRLDSNDLDYETHLRQKRQLQALLDRLKLRAEKQ